MRREVVETADGSKTIYIPEMDENYHSGHGALQEAIHVFITHGVQFLAKDKLRIFEMGFGTGLNALLALNEAVKSSAIIEYSGIEAYPVNAEEIQLIGYGDLFNREYRSFYEEMHGSAWGEQHVLMPGFLFRKIHGKIEDYHPEKEAYDLIFYDAFGPRAQSDMWALEILRKMYDILVPGGVLVTYCANGQFKRDLRSLGFSLEALPGPPGKREMTRATKRLI